MKVPTPHNSANLGDIAKTVIMPGDPLRAKFIADHYLTDVVCYNEVRNMLGYTGMYHGKRISVQGSGMGIPSMAIYSRELWEGYEVDCIIRVGSAGSLANEKANPTANRVRLGDIIVADSVDTDSNFLIANGLEELNPTASPELIATLNDIAVSKNQEIKIGEIFTSDTFYKDIPGLIEVSKLDVLGVEMETLALYANAAILGKEAIAMYTVSDNPIEQVGISAEQRETGFTNMIELALALAEQCTK